MAAVLELSEDGASYQRKREFLLVNRWAPVEVCISDEGEVFTFDEWGNTGFEHALVWYASDGTKKKEYSLPELFPAKVLAKITQDHRSVSSIHWRNGKPYLNGPHLIVPDVLGGYVCVTNGEPEYRQPEER
jgi:hypothetical protein